MAFERTSGIVKAGVAAALIAWTAPARADDIDHLPATVIFVASTGYWSDATVTDPLPAGETATTKPAEPRQGYYKLVAIRQPNRTSRVYLQQIAAGAAGPQVVSSTELEAITALKPYVTDIRPENSSGATVQPGLMATVSLKTDPAAAEAESWTVLMDDLGELTVEKATN